MSGKQNFFQKIKRWSKLSRKKKDKLDESESFILNAVIKNQDLIPIYKKAETPPLKSILKNKNKIECLSKENIQTEPNMREDIVKKNSEGDSKNGGIEKKNKIKKSIEKASEGQQIEAVSGNNTDNDGNISNDSYTLSSSNSHSSLNETVRKDSFTNYNRLPQKADNISKMDLLQKDNSYINFRKAAIRHFEKNKRRKNFKEKNLKCASDNGRLTSSPQQDTFDIIMFNKLEEYPSERCIDVAHLFESNKYVLKKKRVREKINQSSSFVIPDSIATNSSDNVGQHSSVPSYSAASISCTETNHKPS